MKLTHLLAGIALILTLLLEGQGANIFAIFPTPSVSHQNSCLGFLRGLVARGHNVTVITTDPKLIDEKPPNYRVIDGSINYKVWANYMRDYKIDLQKERSPLEIMAHFEYVFAEFIDVFFSLDEVHEIINMKLSSQGIETTEYEKYDFLDRDDKMIEDGRSFTSWIIRMSRFRVIFHLPIQFHISKRSRYQCWGGIVTQLWETNLKRILGDTEGCRDRKTEYEKYDFRGRDDKMIEDRPKRSFRSWII
ncbi:hypothetical protein LSTR_LSTR002202 [Laodelphax striatellus]|uniref:UDP-glycosyltransferase n=1 Tax=Laodelphax striatellus TaxID=195883 RepID=A0A482XQT8_LAOST|nr:hypothetical protein LSTR_LSTR002202 [Laodelphax striatellus]